LNLKFDDKNIFKAQVEAVPVIEDKKPAPVKKTAPKAIDPFDNLSGGNSDGVEGFNNIDLGGGSSSSDTSSPANNSASLADDIFSQTFGDDSTPVAPTNSATDDDPFSSFGNENSGGVPDENGTNNNVGGINSSGVNITRPNVDAKSAGNSFGKTLGSFFKKSANKTPSAETPSPTPETPSSEKSSLETPEATPSETPAEESDPFAEKPDDAGTTEKAADPFDDPFGEN